MFLVDLDTPRVWLPFAAYKRTPYDYLTISLNFALPESTTLMAVWMTIIYLVLEHTMLLLLMVWILFLEKRMIQQEEGNRRQRRPSPNASSCAEDTSDSTQDQPRQRKWQSVNCARRQDLE